MGWEMPKAVKRKDPEGWQTSVRGPLGLGVITVRL